jgi:imidazoleglycerol-phosphate dehydratase
VEAEKTVAPGICYRLQEVDDVSHVVSGPVHPHAEPITVSDTPPNRTAELARKTRETDIRLRLDLDGSGRAEVSTGVGFLDHMLELFAKHAMVDLTAHCRGDVQVDDHHSTEDVGIALGRAIDEALADKAGIRRYGHCVLPMDETLVTCAVDLGGRPFFAWQAPMPSPKIGTFDSELVAEFWRAVATNGRMNLHVLLHYGANTHHVSEAIFKGLARAIRMACERDPRGGSAVPSTKGVL